jgi:aldehyde dehydrogenase (NAD+)
VTVNDVALHCVVPNAPFGGIGESGYGYYHGKYGFLAFTHLRSIVSPPNWLDKVLSFRYPPYNMSNASKLAIKNHLGFKRGETMADQKIKSKSKSWDLVVTAVKLVVLAMTLATVDNKIGGKSRFLEIVTSSMQWLRAKAGF